MTNIPFRVYLSSLFFFLFSFFLSYFHLVQKPSHDSPENTLYSYRVTSSMSYVLLHTYNTPGCVCYQPPPAKSKFKSTLETDLFTWNTCLYTLGRSDRKEIVVFPQDASVRAELFPSGFIEDDAETTTNGNNNSTNNNNAKRKPRPISEFLHIGDAEKVKKFQSLCSILLFAYVDTHYWSGFSSIDEPRSLLVDSTLPFYRNGIPVFTHPGKEITHRRNNRL